MHFLVLAHGLPSSEARRSSVKSYAKHFTQVGLSADKQAGFFIVPIRGGIANHIRKQPKNANHEKWNARMCGRATLKKEMLVFLKLSWLYPGWSLCRRRVGLLDARDCEICFAFAQAASNRVQRKLLGGGGSFSG